MSSIECIDQAAKTYLSAIGASAIYVAADQDNPVNVGVARDLDKALQRVRRVVSPTASLAWVAWALNYEALVDIAQTPDLLLAPRDDGVKVALRLNELVARIETMAKARGLTLTAHARAMQRAQIYAGYLDEAFDALKREGHMAAFNLAYRLHRLERARENESATPYFAVMSELRALIICALVAEPTNRLMPASIIMEIRQRFPWFTRRRLARTNVRRRRRVDSSM